MSTRIVYDIPAHEYHSGPELSSSTAHTITAYSPAHVKVARPDTASTESGTIVHALLLGESDRLMRIAETSYRANSAKAARKAALDSGLVPVLAHKLTEYELIASILNAKLIARGIDLQRGHNEVSIYWSEDGVECRSRLDQLDGPMIRDLKTCVSAHPNAVARAAVQHGYALQQHVYCSAVEHAFPELTGRLAEHDCRNCGNRCMDMDLDPYCAAVNRPWGLVLHRGKPEECGPESKLWIPDERGKP